MRTALVATFGLIYILQACSPQPVYRLEAETKEKQTSFYQGVEYIHMEKDSLFLTLSYYEHTANLFALEVEILNKSDKIIRVAPDSFGYKSYSGPNRSNPGKALTFNIAEDPEKKILEIDMALSKKKANHNSDELLFATLQGLTIANGITAETPKERQEASEDLTQNTIDQQIDRAEYRSNRSSLRSSRKFWQAKTLRITDLWPGEHVRGLIYFKTDPDAKLYHILMHLDSLDFETWFRQRKYEPAKQNNNY